jgi:ribose transport system ATP-binding protein
MADTAPLLRATSIAKRFGPVVALRSADLSVDAGEIHALLGANGAGKSTLVKILSGVFGADEGLLEVRGEPITPANPPQALAAGLGTVFQDPALIPDLSVDQNFTLTGVPTDKVREWLEQIGITDIDFDVLVRELPLETLRMLDLARALAHEPDVLLLDEITAALPADQADRVFDVMNRWKAAGRSVLFITHRLAEVLRMCDRATILRDGVTSAVVAPREGGEKQLLEAMLGAAATVDYESTARATAIEAPVVLEARDLQSRDTVNGASLELRAGEILGVVALEGQGQERLFDLLSGDRRSQSGDVLVNGEAVTARSPFDMVSRGVVLVPSDRVLALLPKRPVRENLTSPLYNRIRNWFSLRRDEKERVASAIDRLDIDTRAQAQVRRLSGGNQQKVVLGRWLASGFKTLLCFDPTRGIDIQTKRQIYELLRDLADQGNAILLYTSELPEVPLVCDRVLVMYDGQFVHEQDAATATEEVLLAASHGLAGSE